MKPVTALAFLTAALISIGSTPAHAQRDTFKVPFSFSVGNKVLLAGSYEVSRTTHDAILIKSHARTLPRDVVDQLR